MISFWSEDTIHVDSNKRKSHLFLVGPELPIALAIIAENNSRWPSVIFNKDFAGVRDFLFHLSMTFPTNYKSLPFLSGSHYNAHPSHPNHFTEP